jgi:hypothetical protein
MKLNKPLKILVGLATVWVAIYPFLFFGVWWVMVIGPGLRFGAVSSSPSGSPGELPTFFSIAAVTFLLSDCLTVFLMIGLSAFYLLHVIKNDTANEAIRVILGMGAFYVPFIAMPIYYLVFIWPDETPKWARKAEKVVLPASAV